MLDPACLGSAKLWPPQGPLTASNRHPRGPDGMETQTASTATSDPGTYDTHRALIDETIEATVRQHYLPRDMAEEFASFAWERLLASETLSRFQGRCALKTFLTVVIGNLYRDFRNQKWGKWRHSAAARRLGPLALQLELLMERDGYSFDEAVSIMQTNYQLPATRDELYGIHLQLPRRARRRMVGEEELENVGVSAGALEDVAVRGERESRVQEIRHVLRQAIAELTPPDRLVVRLLFEDGFTVAQVATTLNTPQKPLYRRRDALLAEIRRRLEAAGITASDLAYCWPALHGDEA